LSALSVVLKSLRPTSAARRSLEDSLYVIIPRENLGTAKRSQA
jgi:hypothetical protein